MAKNKALLFALGGSFAGILGYFLPWVTISVFVQRSFSGFSLIRMLFGVGSGNVLQELGYSANLIIPALLLSLVPIALLFTGVYSALMVKSGNANKKYGGVITIVSGIVLLIVTGIALLVSITIKEQVGSYVDIGSFIRYGIGFVVTSLSALVVIISGIIIFLKMEPSESNASGYFGQGEISQSLRSLVSDMKSHTKLPVDNHPPISNITLARSPQNHLQSPILAGNQTNLRSSPAAKQQYSESSGQPFLTPQNQGWATSPMPQVSQQTPYNQVPPYLGQNLKPQSPTLPPENPQYPASVQTPKTWRANQGVGWKQRRVQPMLVAPFNPPQHWSGNQQQGVNKLPRQPLGFGQRNSQDQPPLNQADNQNPFDKPWERIRYSGPQRATLTPRVPPILPSPNSAQDQGWIQPPNSPYFGQEDSNNRKDYLSPQEEDPEITRYDSEMYNEIKTSDNN